MDGVESDSEAKCQGTKDMVHAVTHREGMEKLGVFLYFQPGDLQNCSMKIGRIDLHMRTSMEIQPWLELNVIVSQIDWDIDAIVMFSI